MDKELYEFNALKQEYVKITDINEQYEKRKYINDKFRKVKRANLFEAKEIIYPVLRDNIGEKLAEQNFFEAIEAFNFIKDTKRYSEEPQENLVIINNKLLKAYLYLYLETNKTDQKLIEQSHRLFEEQEKLFSTGSFTQKQYEVEKQNFLENKLIYNAIKNGSFWTEVSFSVPFPLGISVEEFDLIIDGTRVSMKTKKIQAGQTIFGVENGVMEINFDKYGLLTRTNIVLRINQYLSESTNKIYHFGESEERSELYVRSLEILNKIISRFRLIENYYWIDEVDMRMIDLNSVKFYAEKKIVREIIMQSENTYTVTDEFTYLSKTKKRELIELLSEEESSILWKELLSDAKNYLLINKLSEAIISLNSAFENFFYSTMRRVFREYEDEELVERFFQGDQMYETFDGKDIIDEATFDKLKASNFLQGGVPSVYKIIRKYYKIVPEKDRIDYSKRKFIKSIDKIRKYRNDIVHGNLAVKLSDKQVYRAIDEFQELSTKMNDKYNKI